MAKSGCVNIDSKEWKDLLNELDNNHLVAFRAYLKNGEVIPSVDSKIVQELKIEAKLNLGDKLTLGMKSPLEEDQFYTDENGNKVDRVSSLLKIFSPVENKVEDFIQDKADRLWKDKDKQTFKIVNERTGLAENYEDYIERRKAELNLGRSKGTVLHLAIEAVINPNKEVVNSQKIKEIIDAVRDEKGQVPFYWEWILNSEEREKADGTTTKHFTNIEKIFDNLGINYFKELDNHMEDIYRDRLSTEVTVNSKEMGIGGTIDMMAEHSDGTYTLVDWKTGRNFSGVSEFEDMFLMRYGDQGTKEITNNSRNRAKLQLTLYAMMLKANNPGMKFRDLEIGWIPNEYIVQNRDIDASVESTAFLGMIEQMFSDKKFLKENGFDENIKEKLLAKDANIFKASEYSTTALDHEEFDDILSKKKSPQQLLDDKIQRIKYLTSKTQDYNSLSQKDKEEINKLTTQVTEALSEGNVVVTKDTYHDMNLMERHLGNYSEVTHPAVQAWKAFKNEREKNANLNATAKVKKFRSLLRPVMKEVERENNIIGIGKVKNYDYDKVYGWAYVREDEEDDTGKSKERLLTATETDPELIARWKKLSPAKKKLLLYINSTFKDYFVGENAFMNQVVTEDPSGKELSQTDLYNMKKNPKDKRIYYNGFFYKVPITTEEIIYRTGEGSYIKGLFKKETIQRLLYEKATMFREREYENWFDSVTAIPVKYLGNDYIDTSKNYTRNLEFMFTTAVTEMERTIQMQDVYSLGIALRNKLASERDPNDPFSPIYKHLVKFMDAKLIHDVQKKSTPIRWGRTKRIRLPMYNPKVGKTEMYPVSIDKAIYALKSWGSAVTMWAKPFRGGGNAVLAIGLTHREAIKGSLAKLKVFGITGDVVDMTIGSELRASKEFAADVFPKMITGDIVKSKMYLLAKKLDYFGDNFELHRLDREALSKHMRGLNRYILFAPYSMPEEYVSLTTMAATLMNLKNKATGKSLYDSYERYELTDENGKGTGEYDVRWIGGVRGKVKNGTGDNIVYKDLKELSGREIASIKKIHERLQGNYRREEALAMEVNAWGKLFMQLKKYFPRLVLNAFHRKRVETDLGRYTQAKDKDGNNIYLDENGKSIPVYEWMARITEGRWVTIGKMMVHIMTLGRYAKEHGWSKLAPEQKTNLLEASLTLAQFMIMYGAYLAMFSHTDDDDTSKRLWKQYLVDNLTQQYNPIDMLRTVKTAGTPIAVMKLVDFAMTGTDLLMATSEHIAGYDDLALTKKGDLRGWNSFAKTVPLLSSFKDIKNRIEKDKSKVFSSTDWLYGGVRLQ